jgi:uncharacterized protein (TIGR02246 family)
MTLDQTTQQSAEPSVQQLVSQLQNAWNAGDGPAFAAPFAEDAHFVTVQGRPIAGRPAIAAGHHGIFSTIYAGSTNTMELLHTESVADGVQLAQTRNTLSVPAGPLAGVRQAIGTLVLRATETGWEIVSSQNTLVEEAR